jgi:hypothetical protein
VPQGSLDVREFFNGTDLDTGLEILRRHRVDFVMTPSNADLEQFATQMVHMTSCPA